MIHLAPAGPPAAGAVPTTEAERVHATRSASAFVGYTCALTWGKVPQITAVRLARDFRIER
jgi:hypothetical protein